eukprot:4382823-Amphidinium_carterae.1
MRTKCPKVGGRTFFGRSALSFRARVTQAHQRAGTVFYRHLAGDAEAPPFQTQNLEPVRFRTEAAVTACLNRKVGQ